LRRRDAALHRAASFLRRTRDRAACAVRASQWSCTCSHRHVERSLAMAARTPARRGRMNIKARLTELGIVLPQAAAPVASYVPVVIAGGLAHVSGQLPFMD